MRQQTLISPNHSLQLLDLVEGFKRSNFHDNNRDISRVEERTRSHSKKKQQRKRKEHILNRAKPLEPIIVTKYTPTYKWFNGYVCFVSIRVYESILKPVGDVKETVLCARRWSIRE